MRMEPNLKRCKTHHHHHNKTKTKTKTTTRIHDLPQEIFCDILSRLPAESLIGNKVVSKFWYNCISDNKFVDAHLTRSRHQWDYQQALVFKLPKQLIKTFPPDRKYELMNFTQHNPHVSKFDFEYQLLDLEKSYSLCFQSSCDGLLLFNHLFNRQELYVVNPVTRKYRDLPILKVDENVYTENCVLIFDASVQNYKVICFSALMDRCYLYTLDAYPSSNKRKAEQITSVAHWRELVMPYEDSSILSPPIMVNNKLHWLASISINNYKELVMHTMDVSKEEFKETKIPFATPTPTPSSWGEKTIIELMGSLCVTDYLKDLKRLDIWSLQDEEKGHWTKISIPYEFELSLGGHLVRTSVYQTRILVTHKNQIFIYDLKNKDWKTINLPEEEHLYAYFVHTNSLVKWG